MMPSPTFQVSLHWIPSSKGGRAAAPKGPTYATTARLASDPLDEAFSVVFRKQGPRKAESVHDLRSLTLLRMKLKGQSPAGLRGKAHVGFKGTGWSGMSRLADRRGQWWSMTLLFPGNLAGKLARLKVGSKLVVLEGRQEVAKGTVLKVTPASSSSVKTEQPVG